MVVVAVGLYNFALDFLFFAVVVVLYEERKLFFLCRCCWALRAHKHLLDSEVGTSC